MVAGVVVSSAALLLMIIGVLLGFHWQKERKELRKDREKYNSRSQARERILLRRVLDTTNNYEEITNPARGTDVAPADRASHHTPRSPPVIRELDSTDVPAQYQLASRSTY